jgi:Arf-GAP with coiled-coil, ANK repeat and PH domain-containing protein
MSEWIMALQHAINAAIYSEDQSPLGKEYGFPRFRERLSFSSMSPSSVHRESEDEEDPVHLLRSFAGNEQCADCKREDPQWASINMGTLLCIECSGIHRGLGVHISKTKSLELDKWDPMTVQVGHWIGSSSLRIDRISQAILYRISEHLCFP